MWWTAVAVIVFLLGAQPVRAQQAGDADVAANPGRPTVSTPATLTPTGYLQFETGVLGAADSPELASQVSLNEVAKLSVASRIELIFSSNPYAHCHTGGRPTDGTGGESVGAQAVLFHGDGARPTLAASYFRSIYGGAVPDLDIGSANQSLVLLASADVRGFHYDANALFNEMAQGGVRRAQFGQTLSISHTAGKRWTIAGELWHFTQPFLRGHAVGNLWAVGYTARSNLVLDAGFNRGLTATSTQWEAFAGFTYLLPHRLWKRR